MKKISILLAVVLSVLLHDSCWSLTGISLMNNLTYDDGINIPFSNPGFTCGIGYDRTFGKGDGHTLSGHKTTTNVPDSLRLYYDGLTYVNVDPLKARDTMMLYCQTHPFATVDPGMWRNAMGYVASQSSNYFLSQPSLYSGDSLTVVTYWQSIFDWVVSIQTLNFDTLYQRTVMFNLCEVAERISYNFACNMWYNYTLRFPGDTSTVRLAWNSIANDRNHQRMIPEDTTAFTVLPFPIKSFGPEVPVTNLGITPKDAVPGTIEVELNPNPASDNAELHYSLPSQDLVDVAIYDMLGRKVAQVQHGTLPRGSGVIPLDLRAIPNGRYFVRLSTLGDRVTRELVIAR
jgi:hypothetical protein